jgi:hypothetical protein
MELAQREELKEVENLQRNQFLQFTVAWDNYMQEYERMAYLSV